MQVICAGVAAAEPTETLGIAGVCSLHCCMRSLENGPYTVSEHHKQTGIAGKQSCAANIETRGSYYVSKHQMGPEIAEVKGEKRFEMASSDIRIRPRHHHIYGAANPILTSPLPKTPSMHPPSQHTHHASPIATTSSQISPPLTQRPSGTPTSPARSEPVSSGCRPTQRHPPPRSRPPQTQPTDSLPPAPARP